MKNVNLNSAKKGKNDEFYTQIEDIEKEITHYKNFFKEKIVYCNCDNPNWSNFYIYFKKSFVELGLKRLISTHYKQNGTSYKMIYDGLVESKQNLEGNGDYASEECIKILKTVDVVVTNPPFSLFRNFLKTLIDSGKHFLIIGNNNSISSKYIFNMYMENKFWFGTKSNCSMKFRIDDSYDKYHLVENSTKYCRINCISWFTNIKHNKRSNPLKLIKIYNEEEYPKYDNYDAIEVSRVKDIPIDYYGVMGVPLTFLGKHNPEEFEILGLANGNEYPKIKPTKKYVNPIYLEKGLIVRKASNINSRSTLKIKCESDKYYKADNAKYPLQVLYARILIRRL